MKQHQIIQNYFHDQSIVKIIQLNHQLFLVKDSNKPWTVFDASNSNTYSFFDHFCKNIVTNFQKKNITSDSNGNTWIHSRGKLIKYDVQLDSCYSFNTDFPNTSSIFNINNNLIGYIINNKLYTYNKTTHKSAPLVVNGRHLEIKAYKEHYYFDRDGVLWIATSKGLYKINLDQGRSEVLGLEHGFTDNRFTFIHQDENKKFWLGTYNNGLQIYDPATGLIQSINENKGLANNTVAGILEDNEGMIWVSTFKGLSILTPDGNVIANFYKEDGLIHNEGNRSAFLKSQDGKILFGTIKGLSVIDPVLLKAKIKAQSKANIYLTSIEYYNSNSKRDTIQQYHLNNLDRIVLPATQKYFSLSFALSNYVHPEKNQFAYKLEGFDKNWTLIGNQHKINLNSLPSGKYNLLVKGKDANGIWSANQIIIPIHAKEFFYKQYWFYLLCAFPFALFTFLWIQRLMSEKNRMAIEIQKATEKIQKDKTLIEQQAEQLLELDKAKSRFFTNISHEFRTPLTIISGMVDQVKSKPELWLEKGTTMIKENTHNLLNLINQILDLRKLETQNLELNLVQGDIVQYLRYIISSFQPFAKSNGLQLHFLAVQSSIQMDYDADKMLRIVSNLLSNALKYTPKEGHVYFHVDKKEINAEDFLQIRVQDTGKGIPKDQIQHIFDRFFQVNEKTITKTGQSTGIGLALVKELVKLMNGSIKVESELEKGTTFEIQLPITTNSPVTNVQTELPDYIAQVESSTPEAFIQSSEPAEKPNLLIVEDNADVVQFLIAYLEEHYHLLIARNGQEGIDKAIEQVPDLIVSDVMMPQKDGFELCDTLKTDERTSHIPIILLTAKADFESKIEGLEKGADAYLAKPFEPKELLVRLEKLLELRKQLQQKYKSFSPQSTGSSPEDAFIQKVQKAVLDNLDNEDFGIVHLCRTLAMSRTQVHHKIKALTGKSTSIFIRSIRLQKGRELLQTTDLSVSEVAYRVGFRQHSHFSKFYSEEFGETPSRTRK